VGYELAVKPKIAEYYPRRVEFEEGEERRIRLVKGEEARAVLSHALLPLYTSRSLYGLVKPPERVYYRVCLQGSGHRVLASSPLLNIPDTFAACLPCNPLYASLRGHGASF